MGGEKYTITSGHISPVFSSNTKQIKLASEEAK
jgi:hypothetical protein